MSKTRRFGFTAVMILAAAATLAAQVRPDFSGTWVFDPKASEATGGARGVSIRHTTAGGQVGR